MEVKGKAKVGSDKQARIIHHCKMMDRERGSAVSDIMNQMDLGKPVSRPANRSVSRPAVSQSAIRPVGQLAVSQSASQPDSQSLSQAGNHQSDR